MKDEALPLATDSEGYKHHLLGRKSPIKILMFHRVTIVIARNFQSDFSIFYRYFSLESEILSFLLLFGASLKLFVSSLVNEECVVKTVRNNFEIFYIGIVSKI